ncbi:MAG: RimI3 [Firmicutes bacterium]|nr:RimI3 [Bacillota bacterium]
MSEAVIRPMCFDDIDAVTNIENKSFAVPWSRAAFEAEIIDNDLARYLVMEVAGLVVAYAGMWIILDEAHVTNVAVLPEYRSQGLGHKLLEALVSYAREFRAVCMTLEVRESNLPARRLYQDLGFAVRGRRRQYYTDTQEDALIMWKDNLSDE